MTDEKKISPKKQFRSVAAHICTSQKKNVQYQFNYFDAIFSKDISILLTLLSTFYIDFLYAILIFTCQKQNADRLKKLSDTEMTVDESFELSSTTDRLYLGCVENVTNAKEIRQAVLGTTACLLFLFYLISLHLLSQPVCKCSEIATFLFLLSLFAFFSQVFNQNVVFSFR